MDKVADPNVSFTRRELYSVSLLGQHMGTLKHLNEHSVLASPQFRLGYFFLQLSQTFLPLLNLSEGPGERNKDIHDNMPAPYVLNKV